MEDIAEIKGGTTIPAEDECATGLIKYIKVSDLNTLGNEHEIVKSNRYANHWNVNQEIKAFSIIFPKRGGAIFTNKRRINKETLLADLNLMSIHPLDCFEYVALWFNSIDLGAIQSGSNIPQINNKDLEPLWVPLPPIAEQERIVSKVQSLFQVIDSISNENAFLSECISSAKSKILELAITGQLVPQNLDDEPASELLKRINPKAEIVTDNAHYPQLPDNWCLARLGDILDYKQPQAYIVSSTDYDDANPTPVLTAGKSFIIGYTGEDFGVYNAIPCIIFDDFTTDSKYADFPFKVKSSAMKILRPKGELNLEYVRWFMSITRLSGDTHKRYWISEYAKICIPLPPINEQDRIVAKINDLFSSFTNIIEQCE